MIRVPCLSQPHVVLQSQQEKKNSIIRSQCRKARMYLKTKLKMSLYILYNLFFGLFFLMLFLLCFSFAHIYIHVIRFLSSFFRWYIRLLLEFIFIPPSFFSNIIMVELKHRTATASLSIIGLCLAFSSLFTYFFVRSFIYSFCSLEFVNPLDRFGTNITYETTTYLFYFSHMHSKIICWFI